MNRNHATSRRRRLFVAGAAAALTLLGAGAAAAHEFWIEPMSFWLPGPGEVSANLMVGSYAERDRWEKGPDHVARVVRHGPGGEQDLRSALRSPDADADAELHLTAPGLHLIAIETRESLQELPAARFNAYAKEEGLRLALAERSRLRAEHRSGREAYSRRAKAMIQVGPQSPDTAVATLRLGQTLEIVPERDPFTLPPGQRLPVRVYFEDRPQAGVTVELVSLDIAGGRVARQVTDAAGRTTLALPRVGSWLVSAIWSKPVQRADADFETVFASLTFGYPRARAKE